MSCNSSVFDLSDRGTVQAPGKPWHESSGLLYSGLSRSFAFPFSARSPCLKLCGTGRPPPRFLSRPVPDSFGLSSLLELCHALLAHFVLFHFIHPPPRATCRDARCVRTARSRNGSRALFLCNQARLPSHGRGEGGKEFSGDVLVCNISLRGAFRKKFVWATTRPEQESFQRELPTLRTALLLLRDQDFHMRGAYDQGFMSIA